MKSKRIINKDRRVISPLTRSKEIPLVIKHAHGVIITDVDGKEYLDFAAGVAVMSAGYNNHHVNDAIIRQLDKITHIGFTDFYAEEPVTFAEKLLRLSGYSKAFFTNSGTESNEAAMKAAMRYTGRQGLIAMTDSFHGRTLGSLSLTANKSSYKKSYASFPVERAYYANCYKCPLNLKYPSCGIACAKDIEKRILKKEKSADDIAALFIEPIQGEGGIIVPPIEYMKEIRRICTDNNILMVSDEVQAGMFRTGEFMAMSNFKVKADISTFAKAIGGGLPLGVVLAKKGLLDHDTGWHATTFGGNMLAIAAGMETLNILEREKRRIKQKGQLVSKRLDIFKNKYKLVGDVRGIGLMQGIEFTKNKKPAIKERNKIISHCYKKGLIVLPAGESTIRIIPPLVITEESLNEGLDILNDAIKKVNYGR